MRWLIVVVVVVVVLAGCAPKCKDLIAGANCPPNSEATCTFPEGPDEPSCSCVAGAKDFTNGAGCVSEAKHTEHIDCCNCLDVEADSAGGHRCLLSNDVGACIAALDSGDTITLSDVNRCLSAAKCGPSCPSEVPK